MVQTYLKGYSNENLERFYNPIDYFKDIDKSLEAPEQQFSIFEWGKIENWPCKVQNCQNCDEFAQST